MLVFSIDAKGYAAILASDTVPGQGTLALMAKMKSLTASRLSGYSHEWKVLPQQITPIQVTKPASSAPAGMVQIPELTSPSKLPELRLKASMTSASMCRIRGRTRRGAFTSISCT